MKKKKLTGKLSLEKSKISKLESSKIVGGTETLNAGSLCGFETDCFCVTLPVNCNGTQGCDPGSGGSACKCL